MSVTGQKERTVASPEPTSQNLQTIRADIPRPTDFDDFWDTTLAGARALAQPLRRIPVTEPVTAFRVEDIRFSGYRGDEVAGWLILPHSQNAPLPLVVEFNGYGGGRGFAHDWLRWPSAGYAYAIMDTRGQGAWWGNGGVTADPHGHGPAAGGYATQGLESPADYYYTRVYADAARLVETLMDLPEVDRTRVAVTGTSQGGGIAIAAAALVPEVAVAMPDVPFGCWWRWSVLNSSEDPYAEVLRYLSVQHELADRALETLDYIDAVNFATRARASALFSVGMLDPVCPPAGVYAAHNAWAAPHEIVAYPHNGHEGGQGRHFIRQTQYLREAFA